MTPNEITEIEDNTSDVAKLIAGVVALFIGIIVFFRYGLGYAAEHYGPFAVFGLVIIAAPTLVYLGVLDFRIVRRLISKRNQPTNKTEV